MVGGVCFTVDFLIFLLFAKILGYNYLWVNFSGFLVSTTINYFLCVFYVFNSGIKHKKSKEFILLFCVSSFSIIVNQSLLYIFVDIINIELLTSKIFATVMAFLLNYFGRSFFVFSGNK
jgi:putative flippase GtrA